MYNINSDVISLWKSVGEKNKGYVIDITVHINRYLCTGKGIMFSTRSDEMVKMLSLTFPLKKRITTTTINRCRNKSNSNDSNNNNNAHMYTSQPTIEFQLTLEHNFIFHSRQKRTEGNWKTLSFSLSLLPFHLCFNGLNLSSY